MFLKVFPKDSYRRIIAGNTISQLVGRAVSAACVFIMSVIIARRFGPEGYGDFVKITTYVGFFYLLADFGINAVYLQRVVASRQSMNARDPAWQLLFGLRLILSSLLILAALLILVLFPVGFGQGYTPLVRLGIQILAPVILFQAITTTTNALFQRMLRYDLATIAQNAGSVVMVIVAVALIYVAPASGPLLGVAAVFLGSITTSLVALSYVKKQIESVRPVFPKRDIVRLFVDAVPLGLALVFNLIYFHADSVILTVYRSTREVGIYGLAYKVFELPLVVPIFFMNSVYPMLLTSMRQGAKNRAHPTTQVVFGKSLLFLLASSVGIGAGLWFTAPLLSVIRPDFSESVAPLRVLLLGLPIFFVSALYMWFIIAEKRQGVLIVIHGIAMLGNILANAVFVPAHGYFASAWITTASEAFVLIVSVLYVSLRKRGNERGIL